MYINMTIQFFVYTLIYLVLALLLKEALDAVNKKYYCADTELNNGNTALGLRRVGVMGGLAIAMLGVLSGDGVGSFKEDVLLTAGYGLLACLFMISSLFITDKLVLPNICNRNEIKNKNIAVGFTELGTLLMTGVIAAASIKGDQGGLIESVIYFLAGQLSVVLLVLIYEKLLNSGKSVLEEIKNNNETAGVYLGSKILAFGLIIQSAVNGGAIPETLTESLIEFIVASCAGMIILAVFEWLTDLIFLRKSTVKEIIKEQNMAEVLVLSSIKISIALILGLAVL
ncbi:hypothetical protein A3715_16865 [Oleiphilus sp. HI0009]|nr:hypothetical protein A3715_16865 [Oleiphilus sp. HI0009]